MTAGYEATLARLPDWVSWSLGEDPDKAGRYSLVVRCDDIGSRLHQMLYIANERSKSAAVQYFALTEVGKALLAGTMPRPDWTP